MRAVIACRPRASKTVLTTPPRRVHDPCMWADPTRTRLGRAASALLLIAAVYAAALVVASFLAPMYTSTSRSSSGEVTHVPATLVDVNGPGVAVVVGLPLVVTLAVACALWQHSRLAMVFAWSLTGLLVAFNLLAMPSVGVFVLPVTAALIVICVAQRGRSTRPDPFDHSPLVR